MSYKTSMCLAVKHMGKFAKILIENKSILAKSEKVLFLELEFKTRPVLKSKLL